MQAPDPVFASCQPATFFYRTALRASDDAENRLEIGLMLCDEVDHLKKEIRKLGKQFGVELIPGRVYDPKRLLPDDDQQLDLFRKQA